MKNVKNYFITLFYAIFGIKSINPSMTAMEVIKCVDTWAWLHEEDVEVNQLWDILSAMRGPDDENYEVKWRTTCVIRHYTLPNVAKGFAMVNEEGKVDFDSLLLESNSNHFVSHIKRAIYNIPELREQHNQWLMTRKNEV